MTAGLETRDPQRPERCAATKLRYVRLIEMLGAMPVIPSWRLGSQWSPWEQPAVVGLPFSLQCSCFWYSDAVWVRNDVLRP